MGFRYAAQAEARKLGLCGWVRNLPDSRVEIVAQGESQRLDSLLQWCSIGPAQARVENVQILQRDDIGDPTYSDFEIAR